MSTLIRSDKRVWLPLVAAGLVALLGLGLIVALAQDLPGDSSRSPDADAPAETRTLPQARWKMRAAATASGPKLDRSEKRIVKKERPRIAATIKGLYDALLLGIAPVGSLGGKSLAPRTAARLASSRLGPPPDMIDVQTTARKARMGIDVASGRRAAAQVSISFKGMLDDKKVRLAHRATLWLERRSGRWKVIAFDATRVRR